MSERGMFGSTVWRRTVIALVTAFLALAATAGGAAASADRGGADFSAQARSLGLDGAEAESLQRRADDYLARTDGIQVAVNKIVLDGGGVLLLALPGEKRARDLASSSGDAAAALPACPYTYACAYSDPNYQGDALFLFTCDRMTPIGWWGTGSWINNQRSTLYVRFYDTAGNLGWTSPGGYSSDPAAPWDWVGWISPC